MVASCCDTFGGEWVGNCLRQLVSCPCACARVWHVHWNQISYHCRGTGYPLHFEVVMKAVLWPASNEMCLCIPYRSKTAYSRTCRDAHISGYLHKCKISWYTCKTIRKYCCSNYSKSVQVGISAYVCVCVCACVWLCVNIMDMTNSKEVQPSWYNPNDVQQTNSRLLISTNIQDFIQSELTPLPHSPQDSEWFRQNQR